MSLSHAEITQRIRNYHSRNPAPLIRVMPKVNVPAVKFLRSVLPEQAPAQVLGWAFAGAARLTPSQRVAHAADLSNLADLAQLPLAASYALAQQLGRRSTVLAGAGGAVLGIAGAAGLVADAPALLVTALATIRRTGQAYGEDPSATLCAAIFALASVDTAEEKQAAWQLALQVSAGKGAKELALREGLERSAERELGKAAFSGMLQKLSGALIRRLGSRKAAALLPVIGAVAGGLVNASFMRDLLEAAQCVFAARRLAAQGELAALQLPALH